MEQTWLVKVMGLAPVLFSFSHVAQTSGSELAWRATDVSTSHLYTCAITTAGGVKCWGHGYGSRPVNVAGLESGVVDIDSGFFQTCVVTSAGGVKCWGRDSFTPVDVCEDLTCGTLLSGVAAITTGETLGEGHSCALTSVGGVKCWGGNTWGQLGNGASTPGSTIPVDVCADAICSAPLLGVVAIDAGLVHTCAVTISGGVKCWGHRYASTPVDVTVPGIPIADVSSSGLHNCVLTTLGEVNCWGYNFYGEAGVGKVGDANVITTGYSPHTCAVTANSGVKCWGANQFGQLGAPSTGICGDRPCSPSPLQVCADASCATPLSDIVTVDSESLHTCAVTTAGRVKCWGSNHYGVLGDGTTVSYSLTPVDVLQDDTDGDGVPDDVDGCPLEDATGLDANGDGCIDSLGAFPELIHTLLNDGEIDSTIVNSLISHIVNAGRSIDSNNICNAVLQLGAFKKEVQALREKKISEEAADLLISYADNVMNSLLSGLPEGGSC